MPDEALELQATSRATADHAPVDHRRMSLSSERALDEQPLLEGDGVGDAVCPVRDPPYACATGTAAPGRFVWMLAVSTGLSGLLFGYDTGVISATLVSIGDALGGRPLTSLDKSVITSCTALLALVVSPTAAALADTRGRRPVIVAADVLFVAGALVQAVSRSVATMVLGRAIVGAAVGAASFVVPLYMAEAAPAALRGRLLTANVLFITLGQVIAYVSGWLLAAHADPRVAWRVMVGLGAVPALVQALVVLAALPESPRWLVRAGRGPEARAVLARVQGTTSGNYDGDTADEDAVADILQAIEADVRTEQEAQRLRRRRQQQHQQHQQHQQQELPLRMTKRCFGVATWLAGDQDTWASLIEERRNRRALAIACLLQGLQQLCGFNSLMYFSATIFALVGFNEPTLTALTVAATNFVFTVVALLLIDRIGRRRVLLWSVPAMAAALLLAAYGFSQLDWWGSTHSTREGGSTTGAARTILASILLYVASYALGLGNVPWMQSELFSLDVRSLGSGLATATNWLANFVIGITFLPLMDVLTPAWMFVLYAGICAVGWLLVNRCYPETCGLTLEAATQLLERDDWGVASGE